MYRFGSTPSAFVPEPGVCVVQRGEWRRRAVPLPSFLFDSRARKS
jgi:hypothetical protein